MIHRKIGIIGCGNMGEALIRGLAPILRKTREPLIASDVTRARRDLISKRYKILITDDNKRLVEYSDIIILAVKPKDIDGVLRDIGELLSKRKLLISIAAGITTKYIEGLVGKDIPVIRVMPNMAAVVGESVSSVTGGTFATRMHIKTAKDIFSSFGDIVEIKEDLVDAITAVSGSGPAYFFYLVEALIEATKDLGLSGETAKSIVLKTLMGSGKLLEVLKEEPSALRARITSKGGTTEAALRVFESKNFKGIVKEAVRRAWDRSRELSKD